MSFKDVFKNSFLQGFQNTNLTMKAVVILLLVAGALGIYLFFVYRLMTDGSFYSKSFNVSLILMCVITAAIIITIQSSVVVSLGMVGALSIVRFRTAVKDPLDLIFMFWSISVGIICGAGMPALAVMLTLGATVLALVFYRLPEVHKSMILVVNASDNSCAEKVFRIVGRYDKKYKVKSRNLTKENTDFLMELRLKDYEELLKELNAIEEVTSVSVVAHRGDSVY
ncbi:MAG: DUF4956 domain-containing protein [Firmicutes bacterium]|nr:DUF4956 domain-containing protein [Bacillota bacterium]